MASLIVASGQNEGAYYPLGRRTNVIGRDEAVPIQIVDQYISRKHMQVRFEQAEQRYYALDMKSKHGVFINKRRITDEMALTDGDEIDIGGVTLLFTEKDFDDRESAMSHYKKVGERARMTRME
ncbi:MAG: FHA domain-containing protein [Planctomycetota bacterium]|jgi:pSer/pThr/pTyr-binding forkhead associated (FHA) protein